MFSLFKKKKERDINFWWLYKEGDKRVNEDGTIPNEVLWEVGSMMRWGTGGASDRCNLNYILEDKLFEHERAVIIAATISSIKRAEDKEYILNWITELLQKKNEGKLKKWDYSDEYQI